MKEWIGRVVEAAKGMWKFRWQGLVVAWIAAIVGTAVVFKIPDQYEATARIFVDTQSILKPLMSGLAVQPNIDQQVVMLSRTLISRPNIEKLVRMADLDLKKESKAEQEAMIEDLMKALEIKSTARDNLYSLSYRNRDPDRAKRVIQSLVSIFVESSLGASRKDTDSAKVFIAEQIKAYEAKLEAAETRLKDFKLRNLELQNADGGLDSAARLGELSSQLGQAKLDLREAETARDAARAQLKGERSDSANVLTQSLLQESAISVATPEIDTRIETQKRNLDNLLQRFTEEHPDVTSVRRMIKELEEQKRKEVQELRKNPTNASAAGGVGNLAYQELNRMAAAAEVQVASLRARVAEYSSRYQQARTMLKTSPQIEAEAAQLNRDYNINKKNYEDLVARRQAAMMSGDLDVVSGVADFRLIDPPRVSPIPVWPNRPLLVLLALVAAVAAGLFGAFAGAQLRPVFNKASELREKIDLPVLGVISLLMTDADRRRERMGLLHFWGASAGLIAMFAVVGIGAIMTRL